MNENTLKTAVILPAAGQSRRFGQAGQSKLEIDLAGRPVLLRAVELFANRPEVSEIIVAADPDAMDAFKLRWGDQLGFLGVKIVPGGRAERWETVQRALEAVGDAVTHVAVHDAARPVADHEMISRVFEAAKQFPAVVPATPVHATIKRIGEPAAPGGGGGGGGATEGGGDPLDAILGDAGKEEAVQAWQVRETVPRDGLWMVQTPQVVRADLLGKAYEKVKAGAIATDQITDDAGLMEAMGEQVVVVQGDPLNVKITVREDLAFAEVVLKLRQGGGSLGEDPLGPKRKFPTWADSDED